MAKAVGTIPIKDRAHVHQMLSAVGRWLELLEEYPGWKEWNRRKLTLTLYQEDWDERVKNTPEEFVFSVEVDQQHEVVFQFLGLYQTLQALRDCEYYFRRYPFHGLPVSHHDHLTNICEMYFGRFYEFRERLKKYLNAVDTTLKNKKLDVGALIKQFDKFFDSELRARNSVHHHQRFADAAIDRVYLTSALSKQGIDDEWVSERKAHYRAVTREWADRVRKRSEVVAEFLDAAAQVTLTSCDFLQAPRH
ncbi:hypothetical protein [Pseudomonas monteilii]|uniref:hypothetical protein n=1 Tax=Pseudomonas monteilii TaxID=76759 RepID=UPI001FD11726|nr:hypothetical protein [Pseudomonas monteilii]MCJ7851575.1 hypothetical protein [Pseudomonas monteilii]